MKENANSKLANILASIEEKIKTVEARQAEKPMAYQLRYLNKVTLLYNALSSIQKEYRNILDYIN